MPLSWPNDKSQNSFIFFPPSMFSITVTQCQLGDAGEHLTALAVIIKTVLAEKRRNVLV